MSSRITSTRSSSPSILAKSPRGVHSTEVRRSKREKYWRSMEEFTKIGGQASAQGDGPSLRYSRKSEMEACQRSPYGARTEREGLTPASHRVVGIRHSPEVKKRLPRLSRKWARQAGKGPVYRGGSPGNLGRSAGTPGGLEVSGAAPAAPPVAAGTAALLLVAALLAVAALLSVVALSALSSAAPQPNVFNAIKHPAPHHAVQRSAAFIFSILISCISSLFRRKPLWPDRFAVQTKLDGLCSIRYL